MKVDRSGIRFVGSLARYRDSLWDELCARGYSPLSSMNLLRLMAHLSRWLEGQRLDSQELDSERIGEYLHHRRAAGYVCWCTPLGLEPVLTHLRRVGAIPASERRLTTSSPLDAVLYRYEEYLVQERALVQGTRRSYLDVARQFLSERFATESFALDSLRAIDVTSFIVNQSRSYAVGRVKNTVSALRSLFRYLFAQGETPCDLASAVPAVAGRRLTGLPKALTPEEVRKLLRSCDRRTHIGRRDFAVLSLMLRLGLRAGEVAALNLEDFNWAQGEVTIRGKGGREDRLPLPEDVGEAIVSYLKRGRRESKQRQLFLLARAPYKGISSSTVIGTVACAGKRAGLGAIGSHRLRHTAATQMLRNGASLPEIARALRHQHLDTTAIYAKVDRNRLQSLCRPWPGGQR